MGSKCHGQRKSLTVQLNSRPVRRTELVRFSCSVHRGLLMFYFRAFRSILVDLPFHEPFLDIRKKKAKWFDIQLLLWRFLQLYTACTTFNLYSINKHQKKRKSKKSHDCHEEKICVIASLRECKEERCMSPLCCVFQISH